MKKMLDTIKNMFSKLFGKAKSAANKAAETPEAQDAAHTAATAMSDANPMSNISGKKIFKTLLHNFFILIAGTLFSLSLFIVYKFSAKDNLVAMENLAKYYDTGISFFLNKSPEKAEEQRRRIVETYLVSDKKDQDKWKRAFDDAVNNNTESSLIEDIKSMIGNSVDCNKSAKQQIRDKANLGNTVYQYLLGTMYSEGKCYDKNTAKAREYFEKAINKEYVPAMNSLGEIYEEEENYQKAITLYRKSAENGYRYAQHNLGRMYIHDKVGDYRFYHKLFGKNKAEYNNEKAEYWFRRAAEQGYSESQYKLGILYWLAYKDEYNELKEKKYSSVILPDPVEAAKWLNKASEQGQTDAMVFLADMYDYGDGIAQEKYQAIALLYSAADKDNELAQFKLAVKYHTGAYYLQRNDLEALTLLKNLSKRGNIIAKDYLAKMYANGEGIDLNYSQAYSLFKSIVEDSQNYNYLLDILDIYEKAKQDKSLRLDIFQFLEKMLNLKKEKNKEPKYPSLKSIKGVLLERLGNIFYIGDDVVSKNDAIALDLFKESAKEGNLLSQYKIPLLEDVNMNFDLLNFLKNISQSDGIADASFDNVIVGVNYYLQGNYFYKNNFFNNIPILRYLSKSFRLYNDALKYFNKSLQYNPENFIASTFLGNMYLHGKGVKQDFGKALQYFSKNYDASIMLVYLPVFLNIMAESKDLLNDGAKSSPEDCFAVGFIKFFAGDSTQEYINDYSAIEYIEAADKNGNENAKYFLSKFNENLYNQKKWIEKFANEGNSYAQEKLADFYSEAGNIQESKFWYAKSSEQGNPMAQYKLGKIYYNGTSTELPDYSKAAELFYKSSEKNNFDSSFMLGLMYMYGIGISENIQMATKYLRKAGDIFVQLPPSAFVFDEMDLFKKSSYIYLNDTNERRFARSYYNIDLGSKLKKEKELHIGQEEYFGGTFSNLGFVYKNDSQTKNKNSINELHELAYIDNYEIAQMYLGFLYIDGILVKKDYDEARDLLERASEKGLCPAINILAFLYSEGLGVKQDFYKAYELLKNGAEQKNPTCYTSQYRLADMYLTGKIKDEEAKDKAIFWYDTAANHGDIYAQKALGSIYDKGELLKKDNEKAFKFYLDAALQEDGYSQYLVGHKYQFGEGIKKNYKEAFKWYKKASEHDVFNAQIALGDMYNNGWGVKQNPSKAVFQYRKAAFKGIPEAEYKLGNMYENGLGVKQNYNEAYKWYQFSIAHGNEMAQTALEKINEQEIEASYISASDHYNLGGIYWEKKNFEKAFEWWKKSAEQGLAKAQYNIGVMYGNGQGVKQDYSEAAKWYEKAAEQGDSGGQNNLGYMYYKGYGVKQDYKKAVELFKKSAEQGNASGQDSLGECYYKGHGVEKDYKKAFELCTMSAEQNGAGGQQCLGVLYENGWVVPQDYKKAFDYYSVSANQDYDEAQYNLAQMYEKGRGVKKDLAEARKLYSKAAAQGHKEAQAALERLGKR